MNIVSYNPGMRIVNHEQLGRGTGAKYLEVMEDDARNVLIAVQWRRVKPNTLPRGRALIEFSTRRK